LDVRSEEEIRSSNACYTIAGWLKDLGQARFVDGQMVGMPCFDAVGIEIDDGDLDVETFIGDDSARWPALRRQISSIVG